MRGTKRNETIDLMLLNPYFQGTTSRIGAPFWFGSIFPYRPTARSVRGCIASSMRSPSTYGQSSTWRRWPGICSGSYSVRNSTNFAREVGSRSAMNRASGKPSHGITIDHASTHRSR